MLELPPDLPADLFDRPYVDVDEWRDTPVRHRYVHGGFEGTTTRFSLYMPPAEGYGGRFFQYVTPAPDNENLAQGRTGQEDVLSFALASGAYFVETNGGGDPSRGEQPPSAAIGAYLANAATAEYSRTVARTMYGEHRTYGYLFGGSGGGFRTMAAAENTHDVWQGFAPYVIGSPMAIPYVFCVRMHAQRILRDVLDDIVDALEPGGSGDPYATLDAEQAAALREVTSMGFPLRAWHGHRSIGAHGFPAVRAIVSGIDPSYADDFWTLPGYLGSDATSSVQRDRVRHDATVTSLVAVSELTAMRLPQMPTAPAGSRAGVDESFKGATTFELAAVRLDRAVTADTQGAELHVVDGAAAGAVLNLRFVSADLAVLDIANDPTALAAIAVGDRVRVDNSAYLSAQTYHRHQVPDDRTFRVWDQFRGPDGTPLYPQRAMVVGPLIPRHSLCVEQHGRITAPMIISASMFDREAFAWQASWYHDRVREHFGAGADDHVRLWFTEHALHGDTTREGDPAHYVSYLGTLQSALRSLADWVERGIAPPASTAHEVVDGQIVVPATAADRQGVQPVVRLTADGGPRADVASGDTVTLRVTAEAPVGPIVQVEWDLDGDGEFELSTEIDPTHTLDLEQVCTADHVGTSFVTVRVTVQREGDPASPFARIPNIARARVVAG